MFLVRIIITIFVYITISSCFCHINVEDTYVWYSGLWHGYFFPGNFILNLKDSSILYKAEYYTTAYNVFYWITSWISVGQFIVTALGLDRYIYYNYKNRY